MDDPFYRKRKRRFDPRDLFRRLLRNKRLVAGLVLGVLIAGLALFGDRGFVQRFRLEGQKAELEQKIREAEAEQKRLQQESRSLDSSSATIEKVAREKYGMTRPGESVYRTPPKR
jgi:cell division protein FtsL